MKKARIVIMGKTGVGKSTIINAIMGEAIAETGDGASITRENKVYTCRRLVTTSKTGDGLYGKTNYEISLYDTVGLEIDSNITNGTLQKIKKYIGDAKQGSADKDINVVWFCINERTNRFEDYEVELIKRLSVEYEIPFVIVMTQCISKKAGKLEQEIMAKLPEIPIRRVMAEDYELDDIVIRAFGIEELLELSINDYYHYRIKVFESKINELIAFFDRELKNIEERGNACIADFSKQVKRIGLLPLGCIPVVHGKCIQMISKLNEIGGLTSDNGFADEIFTDVVLGIIATPLMAVPLLSSLVAQAYVETIGESYLKAIMAVVKVSTEDELKDTKLMKRRMKEQLEKNN